VIFQKLQISDRTQAAVYAVQHGLVDQTRRTPSAAHEARLAS